MSESSERIKAYWSRVTSGDRAAQLALSGSAAAIVLVMSLIAWSVSSNDPTSSNEPGSITDRATEALDDPALDDLSSPTDAAGPRGNRSSSPSDATVSAPGVPEIPKGVALTKDAIKVGIAYNKDPGAANAAAGFSNIGQVDQKRAWDIMIADYNRNPVNGRKIVPVYYATTTDDITSKGQDRLEQEACAHYTQDNKVFLVWGGILGGDVLATCLTKAGVPLIGLGNSSRKTFERFPYAVDPTGTAMERMAEFEVEHLVRQGFFKGFKDNQLPYTPQKPADGKARIGLIRYNEPEWDAGAAAMKARLAKHGLSLCSGCEFEISYSSSDVQEQLNDATEVNAAIQNCKGRPDGPCTHMLFLGSTAGVRITIFFLDGAEKQQYRPRLGFNPEDAPTAAAGFLGEAAYPQMLQSMIVTDGPDEFAVRTDAWKDCKRLMEDGGQEVPDDDTNIQGQITIYCDAVWYTRGVLQKAGPTLTLASFMDGVDSAPPTPSSAVYLMQTRAGRHDGSGAIRAGAWSDDCDCFKPKTGIIPV